VAQHIRLADRRRRGLVLVGPQPDARPGTNPQTGRMHFDWGQPATDGLLTEDWSGAASPAIMEILQSLMRARTGPGAAA